MGKLNGKSLSGWCRNILQLGEARN